jgi:hypothetical protein
MPHVLATSGADAVLAVQSVVVVCWLVFDICDLVVVT